MIWGYIRQLASTCIHLRIFFPFIFLPFQQTLLVEGSNAANDSDSEVDLLQNWKREELWRDLNLAASSVGAGISSTAITDTRQGFGSVQQTPSYSPSFSPPSS